MNIKIYSFLQIISYSHFQNIYLEQAIALICLHYAKEPIYQLLWSFWLNGQKCFRLSYLWSNKFNIL